MRRNTLTLLVIKAALFSMVSAKPARACTTVCAVTVTLQQHATLNGTPINTKKIDGFDQRSLLLFREFLAIRRLKPELYNGARASKELIINN